MKLIHFSDTHLGFNDLDIINEQGINQREADVYDAFMQVIEQIKAIKPDYIIHTGDLFHRTHPSNFTFTKYTQDLANLVLRIAISKTLSELSGANSVGFLAFDEVFGSQDENRRMEILEVFHTIKEQYRQIFLISHEMEIKEIFERVVEL
ncbi:MAG: metallophosphoesterase [Sulfurospirillaceae bacterium]|nr:metallophosphoesterase [Sulfurospirillaceae bacterium]